MNKFNQWSLSTAKKTIFSWNTLNILVYPDNGGQCNRLDIIPMFLSCMFSLKLYVSLVCLQFVYTKKSTKSTIAVDNPENVASTDRYIC